MTSPPRGTTGSHTGIRGPAVLLGVVLPKVEASICEDGDEVDELAWLADG